MVNLAAKLFFLQDEDIQWVRETLAAMDVREKVGIVFQRYFVEGIAGSVKG
ncbi:hypothetical protein [Paenibacillus sp. MBLB4367]|uniref:hypothetical protein n=1 Tax=Paenibacillus sp. MBLB4367 TaxID=3384767 RepID=UPI003907EC1C